MNLIFTSFIYLGDKLTDMDLSFKKICLSLISLRKYHPEDAITLVTTTATYSKIDKTYSDILHENRINIIPLHFTYFTIEKEWQVFSERLFFLSNFLEITDESKYEKILYIDYNYMSISSLEDIWTIMDNNVILVKDSDNKDIQSTYHKYTNKDDDINIYSASIFGGSQKLIRDFLKSTHDTYKSLNNNRIRFIEADKTVLSIAASRDDSLIFDASDFINSDNRLLFYLNESTTNQLFTYYLKHKDLPASKKTKNVVKKNEKEKKGFFSFLKSLFHKRK